MRRRAVLVAFVIGVVCSVSAPVETQSTPPRAAMRIVSTSPSITETLFALGLGERVVGVSTYCRYPAEATKLPKVGTFLKPDAEIIARLRPDLVIVHLGPNDVPRQLATLGIRTVTVDRGTLASIYTTTETIGKAAGVPQRAVDLVARIRRRLETIRTQAAARSARRVLIVVGRQPSTLTDLIGVGRGSFLDDLIAVAGGVNVLGDPALPEYPRISMETVIRLEPDVIVDAGDMGETVDEHRRRQPLTEALWRRQVTVKAARSGDVHAVTSDAFVVPGPRVVEAVETIAQWLSVASGR